MASVDLTGHTASFQKYRSCLHSGSQSFRSKIPVRNTHVDWPQQRVMDT